MNTLLSAVLGETHGAACRMQPFIKFPSLRFHISSNILRNNETCFDTVISPSTFCDSGLLLVHLL